MSENRPTNTSPRGKPSDAWRVERMVQPVPGHLGEESRFSPWLVVAAVAVIVLVGGLLLLFTQFPSSTNTPAASSTTATPRARTTVIRITATPAATATETNAPTPVVTTYTVKKGDTLSTIAQKFKVTVQAIQAANGLTDDTIHIGDTLKIPQPTPTPPAMSVVSDVGGQAPTSSLPVFRTPTLMAFSKNSPTPATPTTPTATPGVVPYTVKQGDTLSSIAGVFSTTVQSIIDLNRLNGPSIKAGQALTVPVGIWTVTPTPTVFLSPTPTQTPEFAYSAPDLIFPSDAADFVHGATITLQWLSPGALGADEYYVVHLSYVENGVEQNLPGYAVSEGTSLTLDPNIVPAGSSQPTQFTWYVVVVRGSGCGSASAAAVQPCALSPISEKRTFTWR